jgi:hypothetical protein
MKVTKNSIHRLTIEKDCGCKATREYEDVRYTKPLADGSFSPCNKHSKGVIAEFAGEMLIEALNKEAETAGKTTFVQQETPVGLSGTTGASVTSMGGPKVRKPQDPLAQKTLVRPAPSGHQPTGNLNIAMPAGELSPEELEEAGITMTGDIDGVPADPRIDRVIEEAIEGEGGVLSTLLDAQDAKDQGVPLSLLRETE